MLLSVGWSIGWTFVECGWDWIGAGVRSKVTTRGRAPDGLVAQSSAPPDGAVSWED